MQMKSKIHLSRLYFKKHIRRYLFLLAALSFGFTVITVMTSLSAGMTGSLHEAALRHYGGDLVLIGYNFDRGRKMHISEPLQVERAFRDSVEQSGVPIQAVLKRINHYYDGALFFNGNRVRQKNILGIEWQKESGFIDSMHLVEGRFEGLTQPGSILISEGVAHQLGCRWGDDIVLKAETLTGQRNTGTFVVRGIFRDTSIFGYYKSYIALEELNGLLNYKAGEISSIGIVLEDRHIHRKEIDDIYKALSGHFPMAPPIRTKEELTYQLDHQSWTGTRYFLIPLSVYVSQVDDLLKAMDLMAYFLYIMIALIILVSISVTYKVILKDRTKEIGTMRSLGIQRRDMVGLLLLESFWLFLLSLVVGALLSGVLLQVLTAFRYSRIPGFELFLSGGRLVPRFEIKTMGGNLFLLLFITLPAVLVPSFRISRMDLTRALAGDYS